MKLPFPKTAKVSHQCGEPFKQYFEALRDAKSNLRRELTTDGEDFHLFFA